MTTIAKGNTYELYVPVDSDYTFTPGSGGSIRFGCSSPVGAVRPIDRSIYAVETISIPGGSTFFAEAVGADATSTGSPVSGGGNVTISGDVTITASNAATYNGQTLIWSTAATVTLSAGLPDGFGFAGRPPASGNASIASANTGGLPTLDGATTTVTRALASNKLFAVTDIGADAYTVSGS